MPEILLLILCTVICGAESSVGWFRAANRHFKQASNIAEYDGFKAPFVGGLPRQIHPTILPLYGHGYGTGNLMQDRTPLYGFVPWKARQNA